MSKQTVSIFVLQLEHGKYYVGSSTDPVKCMEEHKEGLGPRWTQIHKPVSMKQIIPFKQPEEVDFYTKITMRTYGVEHVRGGSWEALYLADSDRHALHNDNSSGCCIA
jgi:hypothetical protein